MNLLTTTMNERELLLREIETDDAIFGIRPDGILHVYMKDNLELDVPAQWRMMEVYDELTQGVKTPFIFEAGAGVIVTKEARDNAIKLEQRSPMGACAVIVSNTAYVLIANFYYKFNKPTIPYSVFKRFDKGIEWLKTTSCYQPQRILNNTE
ncbi:hypothetical protein CRYO30217_01224 [Parvicella tangerina]|uniref:DUF7793 domain-containing protein n=2 Tax=Parvicella tangerina TaxID=2829795 RepID=A0A916JLH8_9FLAO|nr:hypothetical protein CRYO30217_01224 [Parvicella tangerina]